MAEAQISPVEVMTKAEFLDERDGGDWEQYKVQCPVAAHNRIRNMRAALRALAEMEPTQAMQAAAERALLGGGVVAWDAVRAGIIAAAQEE